MWLLLKLVVLFEYIICVRKKKHKNDFLTQIMFWILNSES